MKFPERLLIVIFCICLCITCKQFELEDLDNTMNSYRVKMISQYNISGEEVSKDIFNYKDEKLVSWQSCYKNEDGELTQSKKVNAAYNGVNIITTLSYLNNNKWSPQQECNYTVSNNRICEKVVTRLASPECNECWKYKYKYCESKLVEWNKYIKTETDDWLQIRKNTFIYKDNKLIECKDSVYSNNLKMKLDYRKIFVYENGKVVEWFGGICNNDRVWAPTQKTEYSYEQDNIATKTYFVWDSINESWNYFGFVKYYYNENNYLIEETTSSGIRKLYEYEKGCGNTEQIYCEPENKQPAEPTIKGTQMINESIFL